MTYDEKSFELAEHFLQDEAASQDDKHTLAQAIQQAVEDWFFERASRGAIDATTEQPA